MGCCGSELHAQWLSNIKEITGYEQTGCTLSMFANRLSFFFDFKGPSKAVDTGALPLPTCLHGSDISSQSSAPALVHHLQTPALVRVFTKACGIQRSCFCLF